MFGKVLSWDISTESTVLTCLMPFQRVYLAQLKTFNFCIDLYLKKPNMMLIPIELGHTLNKSIYNSWPLHSSSNRITKWQKKVLTQLHLKPVPFNG